MSATFVSLRRVFNLPSDTCWHGHTVHHVAKPIQSNAGSIAVEVGFPAPRVLVLASAVRISALKRATLVALGTLAVQVRTREAEEVSWLHHDPQLRSDTDRLCGLGHHGGVLAGPDSSRSHPALVFLRGICQDSG